MGEKLKALNTIALWILVIVALGYLFFKPDNTLNKDTVAKLTDVVDKLGVASENMTKLANSQREWFDNLKQQQQTNEANRTKQYGTLYEKYGYGNDQDASLSLDSFYDSRVQQQTKDNRGGDVRTKQGGDREAQPVQKSTHQPEGQPH